MMTPGWMRAIAAMTLGLMLSAAAQSADPSAWFGTWSLRAQDAGDEPETLIYSDAGDGAMRMESVEARSVIVTRLDGQPVADTGRPDAGGNALAVTALSPTRYAWVFWMNGEPFVQGENTLAADGRSFTETAWRIGQPDDRTTLIYERR